MADSRKRPDIGEEIIKVCILGILSSLPRGCSTNRILRGLPRTQSPDRLKIFLNDLEDRRLVEKVDLSDFRQNLEGYKITGEGMKFLDKYFNIEFKETRDLIEAISGVTYLHLNAVKRVRVLHQNMDGFNRRDFVLYQLKWTAIYFGSAFVVMILLPFPIDWAVAIPIFLPIQTEAAFEETGC